jgi:biopolymer transport protein TolR
MGASVNGRGKRRLTAEMNVVPYIDVMLVLLVIFMVTAPLLTQGIDVELPKAAAKPMTVEEQPVTLSVDARGNYYLDVGTSRDKPLADEEVTNRVGAVLRTKPETMILLKADGRVPYERVANGMSLLQAAGAPKIGFVMDAPDNKSKRR